MRMDTIPSKFSPRLDGLLTADTILNGDEYDEERVKAFFRGYENLIHRNMDDSVINEYIKRGLPEEPPAKLQKTSGGRKSRKSSRKSRKSRKNKKSKKIRK